MSIKNKVLAAAATLTLVGGVGAMGTLTASAATPSCGFGCVNIFSRDFGTHANPNFVLDTLRQGEKVGQPQILFRTANFDPAEDYTFSYQGTVADFYAAGLVSAAVDLHYGGLAPTRTAQAASSRTTTRSRSSTRLTAWTAVCAWALPRPRWRARRSRCSRVASPPRRCGSSTRPTPCGHGYVPLINGSDTNFSQPFVLTYPGGQFPDRHAAAGTVRQQPDRVPGCERVPDRHHQQQPAVRCRLRRPEVGHAELD